MDPWGDSQVDLQTTLTMLWQNSLSITGQTHEKLTSVCFVMIKNCQIVRSRSLTYCINYKFMCLSAYWQWKLANEHAGISAVIAKIHIEDKQVTIYKMLETNTSVQAKCFTLSGSYLILQLSYAWMSSWFRTFSIALWVYIAFSHRNICKRGNNIKTWQSS